MNHVPRYFVARLRVPVSRTAVRNKKNYVVDRRDNQPPLDIYVYICGPIVTAPGQILLRFIRQDEYIHIGSFNRDARSKDRLYRERR